MITSFFYLTESYRLILKLRGYLKVFKRHRVGSTYFGVDNPEAFLFKLARSFQLRTIASRRSP